MTPARPRLADKDQPPALQLVTAPEADDERLAATARADLRAFAPLYARYAGPIYRYCSARLGSREAAEDATSEVFTKALAALDRYREGVFAAWLFRIAHNVTSDLRRRPPHAPLDAADDRADPAHGVEETAVARAEHEAVWAALATLPDDQRATIELQLAGWPDERIAGALGRSPAAVRMLRLRAHRRLRLLLAEPGDRPAGGAS